jgi:hypothetical protein
VFGIRLLAGRFFDRSDTAKSGRTAVLSQSAARAFFDGASPLGRFVTVNASTDRYEVVGVVGDARFENLRTEGGRMLYLPMSQAGDLLGRGLFDAFLAVKGDRDPIALAAPLREEIRRASPRGFVTSVATLEQQVESSLLQERLISMLATVFGGLALSLACIGLYGLLSYTVVRRTREFGIRLAVGAPRASVIWMVLRDTLRIVAAGLACGVLIVAAAGRYLTSVLFGVTSNDPVSIGAAVSILLGIAITAAYLPARRAGRINPTTALREE